MNMQNSFPVKYAVLKCEEYVGWRCDSDLKTVANIAAKCYIISELKRYSPDLTYKIKYEVVFMCELNSEYPNGIKENKPESNGYHCHSVVIENVFDTFDEAKAKANEENKKITIFEIVDNEVDKIKIVRKNMDDIIKEYEKCEMLYEEFTKDIEITDLSKTRQKIKIKVK